MSETPMTLPLSVVVELNDLRTRLAGLANPPREVFLALYDGAEPELFTTVEAARAYCDDLAPVDAYGKGWDWLVNEHGIHVQFWTHPDDDRPLSETSGSVTAVVVQGPEPVASVRVGDRVEVTAAQSYEITWDEDGDRIVGEFGTVLEVSVRAVEDNAASGTRDATPYRVRLDGGEAVWAADVRPEAEGLRRRIAEGEEYGERLRARVAELELGRHSTNEALDDAVQALRRDEPAEVSVPRTERSYWVDIAAALNAAVAVGMPVGVDLDGTLTDHNAWSVVWDRAAERWTVAGYEDEPKAPGACKACGSAPDSWCPGCGARQKGCYCGFEANPCTHADASWGGVRDV